MLKELLDVILAVKDDRRQKLINVTLAVKDDTCSGELTTSCLTPVSGVSLATSSVLMLAGVEEDVAGAFASKCSMKSGLYQCN